MKFSDEVLNLGNTPGILEDIIGDQTPFLRGRIIIDPDTNAGWRDTGISFQQLWTGNVSQNFPTLLYNVIHYNYNENDPNIFQFGVYTTPDDGFMHPYRASAYLEIYWNKAIVDYKQIYIQYTNRNNVQEQAVLVKTSKQNQNYDVGIHNFDFWAYPNTDIIFFALSENGLPFDCDLYGCLEQLSPINISIAPIPQEPVLIELSNATGVNKFITATILNTTNVSGLTAINMPPNTTAQGFSSDINLNADNTIQITSPTDTFNVNSILLGGTSTPIPYTIVDNGTTHPTITLTIDHTIVLNGLVINWV